MKINDKKIDHFPSDPEKPAKIGCSRTIDAMICGYTENNIYIKWRDTPTEHYEFIRSTRKISSLKPAYIEDVVMNLTLGFLSKEDKELYTPEDLEVFFIFF